MRWSLKQKSWRAVLIRIALLMVLWLVVAFVFATELFLSARGMPIQITWSDALRNAIHDWFPWMILSPMAVVLAGWFRFDRNNWRRSAMIHFAACIFFTFAYEGLVMLVSPGPFFVSTGGVEGGIGVFSTRDAPPPDLAMGGTVQALDLPPLPSPKGSNAVIIQSRHFSVSRGPVSVAVRSNDDVIFGKAGGFASLEVPPRQVRLGFWNFPQPGRQWTQFLHLAMTRMQFTVPIYLCIICICWVISHFQEAGERERHTLELQTRLTQANLQTLKMQLQPHFLFNTLNAISSLIHENPRVADDMVISLSQFLRTTLDVASENEIPLHRELEFIDRYLQIQQTRFGDRLCIVRNIETGVMNALVPPLILQPLVENAIRHGIESREGGGTIMIRISRDTERLHLEIVDDGQGFKGKQLLEIQTGIGLSNTKARLQELYGDKHQFKLTANEPTGARVIIDLPFQLAAEQEQPGSRRCTSSELLLRN